MKDTSFPCKSCGAFLVFKPGTSGMTCEYCGCENEIPKSDELIEEIDYDGFINQLIDVQPQMELRTLKCNSCGAETTLQANVVAHECSFCGNPMVANTAETHSILKPKSLLPFKIPQKEGLDMFHKWVAGLWFAPNKLQKMDKLNKLDGVYTPYWTYDASTTTQYSGMRGDNYYETEYYTDNEGNRQSRTVTKTRWSPASGTVNNEFDDVLVVGSNSLPKSHADALEPWDLANLEPFDERYLSGFVTECYQVDVKNGLGVAKKKMSPVIESSVRSDIGGDKQQVTFMSVEYQNITFKHILLPIWISAYKYNGKSYRFLVNGRTGEVRGERPYSTGKIVGTIISVLLVIVAFYSEPIAGLIALVIFLVLLFKVFK
ncbi:MAG: hypothetical protein SNJ77_08320 [Cytophagales bacterium]